MHYNVERQHRKCHPAQLRKRTARRLLMTYAIADTDTEIGRTPQVPDGTFGVPFLGESVEWLKDMPTFFAARYHADRLTTTQTSV